MVENKNTTIENTRNVVKNTKCITENVKSAIKETERAEKAYFITTKELAEAGRDNIPDELISSKHLIYSSPATLAYNSPGAQGFGVKRAGLAIPGSVMLLLAPGCCGRNTTILSELGGYTRHGNRAER